MVAERFHFDEYVLQSDSGELWVGQEAVPLQPQPARLLEALLRASGQVVTREELGELLWSHEHHVDRDLGINQCVRQIRKALDDDAQEPRYVETLPKRGYRFLRPVRLEAETSAGAVAAAQAHRSGRRLGVVAACIALVLLAAVLWRAQAAGLDNGRLALLPVRNLTGSERWDPLSEALAVTLSTRLAGTLGSRVDLVVRESADEGDGGLPEIGRESGAGLLLRVCLGRDGDGLRATARLIDSREGLLLWTYEGALDPDDPNAWVGRLVQGLNARLAT
ncbi:MAG: winged helix-turn-helix domain-containing protein [Thermoanaerobaculia bacterium]